MPRDLSVGVTGLSKREGIVETLEMLTVGGG